MQNCSKLLVAKSSKPKMSRTPMDKHWKIKVFSVSDTRIWNVYICLCVSSVTCVSREQTPPCPSCWAERDWSVGRSNQTRRCTEIWPWSLWLWWPGWKREKSNTSTARELQEGSVFFFYSVYTIWDYLFNYIHIRFFFFKLKHTEWRQEMTKCWRIIIWHTDTLHVLQWGVKSFNHNIFYFICQQWKWQRLLV